MEKNKARKKRNKIAIVVGALVSILALGIAGVLAGNTTISLNSGTPLSLGAGYTTATSCDNAVDVSATQVYDVNAFKVNAIKVTNIGDPTCGNKTLTLVAVVNGTPRTATFSIGTPANGANIYTWNESSTTSLASFALDLLSTIAVGIS